MITPMGMTHSPHNQNQLLQHHRYPPLAQPCHMFAPILPGSQPLSSEWHTEMDSSCDLDDWLQGTFQETTMADHTHAVTASRSVAPPQQMAMIPKKMNQEKLSMVVSKIDARIALLQELKTKLIGSSPPATAPATRAPESSTSTQPCASPASSPNQDKFSTEATPPPASEDVPRAVSVSSASTNSRKRRASEQDSTGDDSGSDSEDGGGVPDQVLTRREQNRVSAKKSRARKKQKMDNLQKFLDSIKDENKRLKVFVESKLGRAKARTLVTQRKEAIRKRNATLSTKHFVAAMRNPGNRVVTGDALAFLKRLSEDVASATK